MRKIAIGVVSTLFLLSSTSFANSAAAAKNEISVPCYNGGYVFGLAGYTMPMESSPVDSPIDEESAWLVVL